MVYAPATHTSPAALPELQPRTLVVNGFAKAYAMDGWRLGWLAGPKELVVPALRTRQFTTTCPPTFIQDAAVSALQETEQARAAMLAAFAERREAALELLAQQDIVRVAGAQGAFYLYLSYPEKLGFSEDIAVALLDDQHVALVPGTAFDTTTQGHHTLRFSYASSLEDVREGITRVCRFFSSASSTPLTEGTHT